MPEAILSFRDLRVYQQSFRLQQTVFQITKTWPREEKFALIDQTRRSSRAVGANVAESWAKRKYPAHFVSKLTDADGELQETSHWLATAQACDYLTENQLADLHHDIEAIGRMLGKMILKPESFHPRR